VSDEAALLEAVRTNPEDLTLRLIYADWCEEQGDEARARFIRLQLLEEPDSAAEAAELLYRHRPRWDGERHRLLERGPLRGCVRARRGPVHRWEYRRGFIEALTVHPRTFLEHGEELLRLGPLREVRLVGSHIPWGELAAAPQVARLQTIVVRLAEAGHVQFTAYGPRLTSELLGGAEVVLRQRSHGKGGEQRLGGKPGRLRIVVLGG
jgi:uncharacterized protein (TIGR02996 family)